MSAVELLQNLPKADYTTRKALDDILVAISTEFTGVQKTLNSIHSNTDIVDLKASFEKDRSDIGDIFKTMVTCFISSKKQRLDIPNVKVCCDALIKRLDKMQQFHKFLRTQQ